MWQNLFERCLGTDRHMRGQELLPSEAVVAAAVVECCKHILKIKKNLLIIKPSHSVEVF